MSGLETVGWALVWLGGLVWLVRWPIVTCGSVVALVAGSVHPAGFWLALVATAAVSVGWRFFGPQERLLGMYPELALVAGGGLVAVLAGGQLAAAGLAVAVVALGRLSCVVTGYRWSSAAPAGLGAEGAPPEPARLLGTSAWRVDFGPCRSCGGLLVASGRPQVDPQVGTVFVAQATCTACGLRLEGVGDVSAPQRGVTWIAPEGRAP